MSANPLASALLALMLAVITGHSTATAGGLDQTPPVMSSATPSAPSVGAMFAQAVASGVDAEKVFNTRCARCHTVDRVTGDLGKRDAATLRDWLDAYLARHYPPDAATRKALHDWLLKKLGRAS